MLATLLAALVPAFARPQAEDPAPFRMELPAGYGPFVRDGADGERWRALESGGEGQFLLARLALEAPGAQAEAVAGDSRVRQWQPRLAGLRPAWTPWRGAWAGQPAAGTEVRFTQEGRSRAILERFLVLDDTLIAASWEGPAAGLAAARQALDSLVLPRAWIPPPPPEHDAQRGLGPGALVIASPVTLALSVRVPADFSRMEVELRARTPEPAQAADWSWPEPPALATLAGPPALTDGEWSVRYSVALDGAGADQAGGLYLAFDGLAALDPGWIHAPHAAQAGGAAGAVHAPPAWSLEILVPSHLTAVSWTAPSAESLSEDMGGRQLRFPAMPAGRAWPFFVVGNFRATNMAGRVLWQRSSARSLAPEAPLRFLRSLSEACAGWLPDADTGWAVASFPGCGDRPRPGLLLLDEGSGWLSSPLDGAWWRGQTRRTGLAQRVAEQVFGVHLRGAGSGTPFLEASLSAYAAWRLLEACGRTQEAAALAGLWQQAERQGPPLPRPLSLLPPGDLLGPERFLTRGPLVWRAIEARAGRAELDALLRERVRQGGYWTTEDLRADLERRTGELWEEFFQRHLYGRELP